MDRYEYTKLPLDIIPAEMILKLLQDLAHKGFLYMETQKGIHGLPQAGNIVYDKLKQHQTKFGYEPAPITPGLWRHQTWTLHFSLIGDEFGVQYEIQLTN